MKTIMIIDDDPGIQDAMSLLFEGDYNIVAYRNASSVIKGQFSILDIFLVDKQLPGIDGVDVCRYLKHHPLTKDIPVIVMSASPTAGALARAAGADMFIEKPYSARQLREVVLQLAS